MAATRANPFRGFVDMITEMERARRVGRAGRDTRPPASGHEADAWVPPADIFASGNDLVIRLEIAGVAGEDVEITLDDGVLTVAGERDTDPGEGVTVYALERRHGPFRRSMILPADVEEEHVEAVLDDGVVEITVRGAGAAVTGPARIPVGDRSRPQVLRGRPNRPAGAGDR